MPMGVVLVCVCVKTQPECVLCVYLSYRFGRLGKSCVFSPLVLRLDDTSERILYTETRLFVDDRRDARLNCFVDFW